LIDGSAIIVVFQKMLQVFACFVCFIAINVAYLTLKIDVFLRNTQK